MSIYVNLLNSMKRKFQYSVRLRLFDNRINSSNQTVVAVLSLLEINNYFDLRLVDFCATYDGSYC